MLTTSHTAMKLILAVLLLFSSIASCALTLKDVAYKMKNAEYEAYAYQGEVDITGTPTDSQLAGYAITAATKMRQMWRDDGWSEALGAGEMPYTMSAFWPGTGHNKVYLHSSVKGGYSTVLKNMQKGQVASKSAANIAAEVMAALEECGGSRNHGNLGNCAEVMVINFFALNVPSSKIKDLDGKRIITAAISNLSDAPAFIFAPCSGRPDSGRSAGCVDFLEKLGIYVCSENTTPSVRRMLLRRQDPPAGKKKASTGTKPKQQAVGTKQKEPTPPKKKQTAKEISALIARDDSCPMPSKKPATPAAGGAGATPPYQCPAGQEPQLKKNAKSGKMQPVLKKNAKTGKMEPVCVKKGSQPTLGGTVKPAAGKPAGAAKPAGAGKPAGAAKPAAAGKPAKKATGGKP